ncbi:YjfB family protein [Konateibacter massiliensis]|uniref:YjfB family protein n=1 Tax=Konateibacter massiliensis TaxID=2002841 RepID=UPI000C14B01B|nr:YjfB family protein [Konateibacter massiliensis]
MDIPSLSIALSQSKVMSDVSMAMLGKSLDMVEDLSANMTDMIDSAAAPALPIDGLGANIDITL